jgi:hypothetical protein
MKEMCTKHHISGIHYKKENQNMVINTIKQISKSTTYTKSNNPGVLLFFLLH